MRAGSRLADAEHEAVLRLVLDKKLVGVHDLHFVVANPRERYLACLWRLVSHRTL